MSRARNYVFTVNNYDENDLQFYQTACENEELGITFICFGREVAPSTGTPHLQGYLQCRSPTSIRALLNRIRGQGGNIHHCDVARGTAEQNIAYTSKESTESCPHFRSGVLRSTGQGKRTDLDRVVDSIEEGKSYAELASEHGSSIIKYAGGIQRLLALRSPKRSHQTEIWWYWGPTGTGKSKAAWTEFPEAYSKDPSTHWWDGYSGEPVVIIDDYRPSKSIPFNQLLRLGDRYPLTVEVKGAYVNFNSKIIIITTPKPPRETFENLDWIGPEQLDQLERRITKTIRYGDQVEVDRMFSNN